MSRLGWNNSETIAAIAGWHFSITGLSHFLFEHGFFLIKKDGSAARLDKQHRLRKVDMGHYAGRF